MFINTAHRIKWGFFWNSQKWNTTLEIEDISKSTTQCNSFSQG